MRLLGQGDKKVIGYSLYRQTDRQSESITFPHMRAVMMLELNHLNERKSVFASLIQEST